jgi:hypothetical protein
LFFTTDILSAYSECRNIFSKFSEGMNKFKTDHTIEYLELCSSLETVKRNIIEHQKEKVNITIPITCLDELNPSENFEKMLRHSEYADKISVVKNKMQLDPECAKYLFSKTIEEIVSVITGILHKQTGSRRIWCCHWMTYTKLHGYVPDVWTRCDKIYSQFFRLELKFRTLLKVQTHRHILILRLF